MAKDYISEYDATPANNTVVADIDVDENCAAAGINNAIRAIMSHLKGFKNEFEKGADVASATALPVNVPGIYHDVTGTTTVTSFAAPTNDTSHVKILQFDGALTLTHSSGLVLPGAANITTVAGDVGVFAYDGTNWLCVTYFAGAAAYLSKDQSWTGVQRAPTVADTDGSFDLNEAHHFLWTPAATDELTFTNITVGMSGTITLVNPTPYTITIDGTTVEAPTDAATEMSTAGTRTIYYHVPNGETKVHIEVGRAIS